MDVDTIYDLMVNFSLKAGNILMQYRGKVTNKLKSGGVGGDQAEGGLALTVVDEIIQEGFLWELYNLGLGDKIRINCEEKTTLQELFRGNNLEICTVHQDPCDGTKSYLDGKDDFTTGYGISNLENDFTHTVVFAPARSRLYLASPANTLVLDNKLEEVREGIPTNYKIIFSKRALNKKGIAEATKAGFDVRRVESTHCRIIDVALRNAGAYLYGKANPHDSLIPYAFATGRSVSLFNQQGQIISGKDIIITEENGFHTFERVPSVVYVSDENPYKDKLMNIISDKTNLDENF